MFMATEPLRSQPVRAGSWQTPGEMLGSDASSVEQTGHSDVGQAARPLSGSNSGEQRAVWDKTAGYEYMMDVRTQGVPSFVADGGKTTTTTTATGQFTHGGPSASGQYGMGMAGGMPVTHTPGQAYSGGGASTPADFAAMSGMHRGATGHHEHMAYGMAMPQLQQGPAEYQQGEGGSARHDSMQRSSVASSYTQGPAAGMEYQGTGGGGGGGNPTPYQYGQYRGQQQ